MRSASKIYAKEQQIKLIDHILTSLCSIELTSDGRRHIKNMKEKIQKELDELLKKEEQSSEDKLDEPFRGFRFRLPQSLKTPW